MRWTTLTPAIIPAALLVAAPGSAALSDFRLPPDPSDEQRPADVQGPVAPDVPESQAPRPAPTGEAAPAPVPTAAAPRIVLPDLPETGAPARASPAPRPATSPTTRPPAVDDDADAADAAPAGPVVGEVQPGSLAVPEGPPPGDAAPAAPRAARGEEGGSWWFWLVGAVGALAAVVGLGVLAMAMARRRGRPFGAAEAPELERPRLAGGPHAPAPGGSGAAETLQVTLEPLRLSLTLMNATLAYRLEVVNRSPAPIAALHIGADMIAAHASMTREQQLSGPDDAATVQRIERLEPGESRVVEGEFRVPFSRIVPIRQGNAALLLPLARFRLEAEGAAPVVRTFAVGEPGPKAGLQPFRLDLGPRVYPRLIQRAFA